MINVVFDFACGNDYHSEIRIDGHSDDKLVCCAISTLVQHYRTLSYVVGMGTYYVTEEKGIKILDIPMANVIAFKNHIQGIKEQYNADIEIKIV